MLQQTHTVSNKGLQSFVDSSPEYELAPTGIASMHEQAQKLAEYGRNGDIYVVHAAEGETVVPIEVLNANPKVKDLLFKQMEEMGLDPQEFVVGNELNSINPDTGLPEFFIKRVFRAVKRAVKSVVKVVKKAAPIVLPIAAAAFGVPFLGPAFGAGTFGASFLGSGIGTLVGGGSFKDALKSGLISGGLSVASTGIGSLIKGGNIGDALTGSFTGATAVRDTAGNIIGTQYAASPFADALGSSQARIASAAASREQFKDLLGGDITGAFTEEGTLFGPEPTGKSPGFVPATKPTVPDYQALRAQDIARMQAGQSYLPPSPKKVSAGEFLANRVPGDLASGPGVEVASANKSFAPSTPTNYDALRAQDIARMQGKQSYLPPPPKEVSTLESLFGSTGKSIDKGLSQAGDLLTGTMPTDKAINETATKLIRDYPAIYGTSVKGGAQAALEKATSSLTPSLARQYGPTLALGAGAAYLGGAFDEEEVEQPTVDDLEGFVPRETGYDLFQKDRQRYLVQDMNPYRYDPGNPVVPTQFTARAADGGYMQSSDFPRREMLVEGPGTETSDDIPAMLSDGEFVMNAKAVRGADPSGNGNRQAGAANLYNMMRNFEMRS